MPVDVLCPQCQQRYKLKDDLVGKSFRCVKCRNQFVPAATPAPQQTMSPSDETIMGAPPSSASSGEGEQKK